MWQPRLILWSYIAYAGFRQFQDPDSWNIFVGINLPIHEGGHVLFRPFGEFMMFCGGTITQCAAPLIAVGMFIHQRDYFAICFALGWLSTNLLGVGIYMADAVAQALPLVSLGDYALHDWFYIFGKLGLRPHCEGIGAFVRFSAHLTMLLGLAGGAWIIFEMFRNKAEPGCKRRAVF
jgi:hypothetical protein